MEMNKFRLKTAFILLTFLLAASWAHGQSSSKGGDIAVVVHPDTPVTDMNLADVRKVFLGERQYWNSKLPVILLVRAPVAREREVVLHTIYKMSESQFKQFWVAKIFRS